jgi:hypothetical protein
MKKKNIIIFYDYKYITSKLKVQIQRGIISRKANRDRRKGDMK